MYEKVFANSNDVTLYIVTGALGVAVAGGYYWLHQHRGKDRASSTPLAPTKLKNVWNASRNKTSSVSTSDKKKNGYVDKPFGSSYYYAHNSSSTTGGYKDGLRMEDYVMNGPRLLSRNGKTVDDPRTKSEEEDDDSLIPTAPQSKDTDNKATKSSDNISVKYISKYIWDDPGDSKGIATIRIDSLPAHSGNPVETIPWQDANVTSVQADLKGEGLLVKILSNNGDQQQACHLKINKLYGDAAQVKVVQKPKKLLVRIHKKQKAVLSQNKGSNLDAWPQPNRKF